MVSEADELDAGFCCHAKWKDKPRAVPAGGRQAATIDQNAARTPPETPPAGPFATAKIQKFFLFQWLMSDHRPPPGACKISIRSMNLRKG
jgi:hypothetical protein